MHKSPSHDRCSPPSPPAPSLSPSLHSLTLPCIPPPSPPGPVRARCGPPPRRSSASWTCPQQPTWATLPPSAGGRLRPPTPPWGVCPPGCSCSSCTTRVSEAKRGARHGRDMEGVPWRYAAHLPLGPPAHVAHFIGVSPSCLLITALPPPNPRCRHAGRAAGGCAGDAAPARAPPRPIRCAHRPGAGGARPAHGLRRRLSVPGVQVCALGGDGGQDGCFEGRFSGHHRVLFSQCLHLTAFAPPLPPLPGTTTH